MSGQRPYLRKEEKTRLSIKIVKKIMGQYKENNNLSEAFDQQI